MRYGCVYKGSKNAIAEWVYSHFPVRDNFYDLFAGGCAITQRALIMQQFKRYFCNDIDGDGSGDGSGDGDGYGDGYGDGDGSGDGDGD